MNIAVLFAKNTNSNPENRFPDMHVDARSIGDKELPLDLASRGYVLMSQQEWELYQKQNQAMYDSWETLKEQSRFQADQAKQSQFEGFISTLKSLREKITASGKLEPAEQTELYADLIDALIAREQQNT